MNWDMIDIDSLSDFDGGEHRLPSQNDEEETFEKAPRKRKSNAHKGIKTPVKKKSSAVISYKNVRHEGTGKENSDHLKELDMNEIIQAINLNLLIKLNEGSKTYSNQIPWNLIQRKDLVYWPDNAPVKKIMLQGRRNLKIIYSSLDDIKFTTEFLNDWATRFDKDEFSLTIDKNQKQNVRPPSPGENSPLGNSPLYESYKMTNMPYVSADEASEGSPNISDGGEEIDRALDPIGDIVADSVETSVFEGNEIPDLPLQDGILFLYNRRSF